MLSIHLPKKYLAIVLFFALFSAFVLPNQARASSYLSNLTISPSSPSPSNKPVVTGDILPTVRGILILFHNTSYTENSHDFTVSVSNVAGPSFTTADDPFSPISGNAVDCLPDGLYQISVIASDIDLTVLEEQTLPGFYIIDTTAPHITTIDSTQPDGCYNDKEDMNFVVHFSKSVVVDTNIGTPLLILNSGGSATYFSGSGSQQLVFYYDVEPGQNSFDLDILSLNPAGGTIKDTAGNTADLTLPIINFALNHNIIIDTIAPLASAGGDRTERFAFVQSGTASDENSGIAATVWVQQSGPGTVTFGYAATPITSIQADVDGTYILKFIVVDRAGNATFTYMTLFWNSQAPIISLSSPIEGGLYIGSPTVTYSATDVSPVTYQVAVDGITIQNHQPGQTLGTLSDGKHYLTLTATDALGNTSYYERPFWVNSKLNKINFIAVLPSNSKNVEIPDLKNSGIILKDLSTNNNLTLSVGTYSGNPLGTSPDGYSFFKNGFEIFPSDPSKVNFPLTIMIPYKQSDLDAAGITESQLDGIYYFDFATNKYLRYDKTGVNTNDFIGDVKYAGYVYATLDHLTPIAVLARKPVQTVTTSATTTPQAPTKAKVSPPKARAAGNEVKSPTPTAAANLTEQPQTEKPQDDSGLEAANAVNPIDDTSQVKGVSTEEVKFNYWPWIIILFIIFCFLFTQQFFAYRAHRVGAATHSASDKETKKIANKSVWGFDENPPPDKIPKKTKKQKRRKM